MFQVLRYPAAERLPGLRQLGLCHRLPALQLSAGECCIIAADADRT